MPHGVRQGQQSRGLPAPVNGTDLRLDLLIDEIRGLRMDLARLTDDSWVELHDFLVSLNTELVAGEGEAGELLEEPERTTGGEVLAEPARPAPGGRRPRKPKTAT